MDLANPIASLTSPLTGRVLEVLAGTTRPLSGREIHRLSGEGSKTGVWKVLGRLEDQGLVQADHRSSASYFQANREHLAWPAIAELAALRATLRTRLAAEIGDWTVVPLHASLFGSVARGDADRGSDVDVLLVRPERLTAVDQRAWEDQLDRLRERVHAMTGNHAQLLAMPPSRVRQHVAAADPIVDAWRRDGQVLAGRPIEAVIDEGHA